MTTKVLTGAAVERFKPTKARRWVRDGGSRSLFLVIQPSGAKSWVMRFRRRPDGRPAKLTLGPVDLSGAEVTDELTTGMPLSLSAARQLAATIHRDRARGHDPIAEHKARRHRQRAAGDRAAGSFGAVIRRFIEEHAQLRTRSWRATARLLGLAYDKDGGPPVENQGGLAERWADKDVRKIDAHDCFTVVTEARRIGVPGIVARTHGISEARARALYMALSSFFSWARSERLVDANVCVGAFQPYTIAKRERTLTQTEVRWLWAACDTIPPAHAAGVKTLLLTGCRLAEATEMRREELSDDGSTWNLPGARTKNKKPHTVPLAPLVRELIASVQASGGFVFTTDGSSPVGGWSRIKHQLDAAMLTAARKERGPEAVIEPWRVHDLRRTAITGMAELGIRPDVIELAVNHISGSRGGIAGTYNRSELLPERRAALERWAAHVAGLVSPPSDKVIDLPRRARPQGG